MVAATCMSTLCPEEKLPTGVRLAPSVKVWMPPFAGSMLKAAPSVIAKTISVTVLFVSVLVLDTVGTATPSTASTPADERLSVVSDACPNSTEPTPSADDVDAVMLETGRPVQLVRVPEEGVPRVGVVSTGLVKVLLVNVLVLDTVGTSTPSTAKTPAELRESVVSDA